jgi:hypothetical protein
MGSAPCQNWTAQNWTALITRFVSRPARPQPMSRRRAPAKPLTLKGPPFVQFVHDVRFFDFGLLPPILDAVAREGYDTPTPIQSQAGGRQILCACCRRIVALREDKRWRVHLRRGWVR